ASPCNPQASSDRPSWDHFSSNHLGDESCLETGGRIGSWLRSIASNSPGDPKDHTPAPNSDSRSPKSSLSAASAELSALHMEAKMGNATAQYALGLKLLQGDGVRRNEEEAVTWPKPICRRIMGFYAQQRSTISRLFRLWVRQCRVWASMLTSSVQA